MATNLDLDDQLIKEAKDAGNHSTKKAAVTAALVAYIQHHKQLKILELFDQIDYDPKYNYKIERRRKRK